VATGFVSRPDVDYGAGSPATGVNPDNFCARFTGMLLPPVTGVYTFSGTANEAVTLYVNGLQLFVPTSSGSGAITLSAGVKVPIRIDLIETTGTSKVLIEWQPPGAGAATGIPRDVLFSAASGLARPLPPSDLAASVAGTDVALAWADRSADETGFRVEYSTDGLAWTLATTTAANVVGYTVSGLAASTPYRFRVRSTNASGHSAYGAVVQATTGVVGGGGAAGVPGFTPAAGSYVGAQSVTIFSATAGATIRYTTDGSTPTAASTAYAGPVLVAGNATLKAYASKGGLSDSAVASAAYVISGGSSPPSSPTVVAGGSCGLGSGAVALALLLLAVAGTALRGRRRP
jgi:hypothetical protein